jgi:hypothetical protein
MVCCHVFKFQDDEQTTYLGQDRCRTLNPVRGQEV